MNVQNIKIKYKDFLTRHKIRVLHLNENYNLIQIMMMIIINNNKTAVRNMLNQF